MEQCTAIEEQTKRNASGFLHQLFTGVKELALADKDNTGPNMVLLRPAGISRGPRPNSQYIIEKYPDRSYNIKSSVAGWAVPGICDALADVLQQPPTLVAIDEVGRSVDASDPDQRRNIDKIKAQFPDGSSIFWMSAKTQLNIHCPNQRVFDQLISHFTGPSFAPAAGQTI